ncbi:MAG TPA: M13 family metallopeptidase [Clostridiaceae bacterium]|nr:M13 family metallopeptidase [Clostridiaceae bacterium]
MKRFASKLTVLLLCFVLVFGALPVHAESENNGFVTREQAVVSILNTVGYGALNETENDLSGFADASAVTEDYRDEIGIAVTNKILFGSGTTLDPRRNVTRLEFALFLSRTIRELPVIRDSIAFADVPQYAIGDVSRLVRAGLMAGYGDGKFGSGDYLKQEHLEAILDRVRGLKNIRKQDDFYYAVNRDWLINARLPAGYAGWGSFEEVDYLNTQRLRSIVDELYSKAGTYEEGTPEQKLADFYTTILDMENRNKQGMEPIKKYLDMIDSAATAQEMLDIAAQIENETGYNPIFTFGPSEDLIDSSKYSLYGTGMGTVLNQAYLLSDNPNIQAMYENFVSLMLSYLGYTPEQAVQGAKDIYAFERNIAAHTLSNEEKSKVENLYNPVSRSDLVSLFSNVDLDKYLNDLGYESVETIIIIDPGLMAETAALISDQNVEIIKAYEKVHFLIDTAQYLSKELQDTIINFNTVFLGLSSAMSDEDFAFNMLSSVMSSYLGRVFVENYFSPEAKEDVREIAQEIVNTFEKRIERLDWMSESTKQAAIRKLKSIKFKIGYPDTWGDPYKDIDIKTYEEGGSLIGNIFAITAAQARYLKSLLGIPTDKSGWLMPPQTVNAYYNPLNNEIVFPAGILQPPFYDVNASREENLGGIGAIIAHEITHAFDPNGAMFDENGNMKNWWTDEDYAVFGQKCQEIVNLYNGYEIAPNAIVNGNLTVSENVADIGGVACVLEIMKSIPNANYKAFFEKNAQIWRFTATPQMYQLLAQQDTHAPYRLRTNFVLMNFQEFYDTYDIKPGDWMYLEPEKRVGIW